MNELQESIPATKISKIEIDGAKVGVFGQTVMSGGANFFTKFVPNPMAKCVTG